MAKSPKQSLRQIRDAADIDRVAALGDLALETATRVPGNKRPSTKPVYYRGALVRGREP